jgi:hypothetical protein
MLLGFFLGIAACILAILIWNKLLDWADGE